MRNQNCGFIYVRVEKVMYGLLQASIIVHMSLKDNLPPFGYAPTTITPVIWRHKDNETTFTMAADNFGTKHGKKYKNIINALQEKYEATQD